MRDVVQTRKSGLTIASLSLGAFAFGLTEFAAMGLLVTIAGGLEASLATVGLGISVYAIGVVVGAPALTIFASQVDRKLLAVFLMVIFVVGSVWTFLAPTVAMFIVARFVVGLPHGAFFGVASDIVKRVVSPDRLGRGIAWVQLGMQIATFAGVPLVTALGQRVGWRPVFAFVAGFGILTILALVIALPARMTSSPDSSIRRDLAAFKNLKLWVGVAIGAFGLTGVFAIYSYLGPIISDFSGVSIALLPVVQVIFGFGMVVGVLIAGRLADWSPMKATIFGLLFLTFAVVLFGVLSPIAVSVFVTVFFVGIGSQLIGPALQIILMEAAPETPALASALYHSAFNIGNAIGASIGGVFVAASLWQGPAWGGAGVSALGFLIALALAAHVRRQRNHDRRRARMSQPKLDRVGS